MSAPPDEVSRTDRMGAPLYSWTAAWAWRPLFVRTTPRCARAALSRTALNSLNPMPNNLESQLQSSMCLDSVHDPTCVGRLAKNNVEPEASAITSVQSSLFEALPSVRHQGGLPQRLCIRERLNPLALEGPDRCGRYPQSHENTFVWTSIEDTH